MFKCLVESCREFWGEVGRGDSKRCFVQVGDLRKLCLVTTALCDSAVNKGYGRAWIVRERATTEPDKLRHSEVELI
jgi:hypothetical protein